MHYYRFRPNSELSLKELLYSEIFFASPDECNDPFDSMAFCVFPKDLDRWIRCVSASEIFSRRKHDQRIAIDLATIFNDLSPISFVKALEVCSNLVSSSLGNIKLLEFHEVILSVKKMLEIYKPPIRYFASFSSVNNNVKMWSSYASNHTGYCLIFKPINNTLGLNPLLRRHSVQRRTPGGISKQISFEFPDIFHFVKMEYQGSVAPLDAFKQLPAIIDNKKYTEEEKKEEYKMRVSPYAQKSIDWEYEREARLMLEPPPSFLAGQVIDYSKQERLFHYDPFQLVGVIYGARMNAMDRARLGEVLRHRDRMLSMGYFFDYVRFDFVEFEARLSDSNRAIEIVPLLIQSIPPKKKGEPDFERLYQEWIEGVGFERTKNGSRRVNVDEEGYVPISRSSTF